MSAFRASLREAQTGRPSQMLDPMDLPGFIDDMEDDLHNSQASGGSQLRRAAIGGSGDESSQSPQLSRSRSDKRPLGWYGRKKLWYRRKAKEQAKRLKDGKGHRFPRIRWIAMSGAFEFILSTLIIANCVFIGFQAQSRDPDEMEAFILTVLEHFFTACFFVDLIIRVFAHGWTFLFDRANFVDVFLVVLSVTVTWIMVPIGLDFEILRKLTVLRTLRLVRLARSVRTRPEFKEMWSLLKGLVDSRETLVWTYVMIALLLYFFAIISTSLIGKTEQFANDEVAQMYFGDVPKSMLTLFQIMTLDSWSQICRPLMDSGQVWIGFFFVGFISVAQFVLMNLITAVIVENAFSDAKSEDKELAMKLAEQKVAELAELKTFFKAIDLDGSGTVTREEIHSASKQRKVRQKLCALDILPKDIDELWEILDDGDGQLSCDEFVGALQRLRGEAKAKDIMRLQRELRILEASVAQIDHSMDDSHNKMQRVKKLLKRSSMDIAGMHRTVLKAQESIKHVAHTQSLRTPR